MIELEVQKATQIDLLDLKSLLQAAKKFKESKGDTVWGKRKFPDEEVQTAIETGHTFLARIDGSVVGSLMLVWDDARMWGQDIGLDSKAGYVHKLVTSNEHRGEGLGAKLLDWASDQARMNGKQYLRLDCEIENDSLRSYYEGLGFEPQGEQLLDSYKAILFQREV